MRWLAARTLRRAPRRLVLAAVAVMFPVAVLGSTLLFIQQSVHTMTRVALEPLQVEMRALATSLSTDLGPVARDLQAATGIRRVERFASADVIVSSPDGRGRVTARLFAVDPSYLQSHRWLSGASALGGHALLNSALRAAPRFGSPGSVRIDLPGDSKPLGVRVPVGGTIDLRAATTWFAIPAGEVQGDVAVVPRAVVIDYAVFQRSILPALRATFTGSTAVANPGLTDLPPASVELHLAVDHSAYPSDPGRAARWSAALQRVLERRAPGTIIVADNAAEPLAEASVDATNAKVLFLLLGIPGALVAGALGVAAAAALEEALGRENALLQLRGATDLQIARLAVLHDAVAWLVGSVIGLGLAVGAVSLAVGHPGWRGVPTGQLAVSLLLAAAAGLLTTAVRLVPRLRRHARTPAEPRRQSTQSGWLPRWRRNRLDLLAITVGLLILAGNLLAGGLRQTPIEAATLALSFYVLLAPIALWLGLTLLAVRGLLVWLARRTDPERPRPLTSWPAAALRWLGRRPARTGAAVVLGSLAVAFGVQVAAFAATYTAAKQADTRAAFGSDLRLTPAPDYHGGPPPLGSDLGAVTPIRLVPARAGSDRKTIMAVDLGTFDQARTTPSVLLRGGGLEALSADPAGVLVAPEIVDLFDLQVGDTLPVTVFPDDLDLAQKLDLHVAGVFRDFPPTEPVSELVMSTAGLPPVLPEPDYYLARVTPGRTPAAVAQRLAHTAGPTPSFSVVTIADQASRTRRSLTTLSLGGLSRIETTAAALIAAVGIAVLGTFIVLERRREFAILRSVGADPSQLCASPAIEGSTAALTSLAIGVPVGLGIGVVSVRVLGLFFALPPPLLTVPVGALLALALLVAVTSALCLGAALLAVTHIQAGPLLREP